MAQPCGRAVFIPKADGGLRPILLYTTVYRVWAKARLDYVRRWEAMHPYPFFWGGKGRAVERCAWTQALLLETGMTAGISGITVASDMSKFFEHIRPCQADSLR